MYKLFFNLKKLVMEFTSFIFGILATVATFTVISNVFLLVKISKLTKQYKDSVRNFQDDLREVYRYADEKHDDFLQTLSVELKDMQSKIDQLADLTYTKSKAA